MGTENIKIHQDNARPHVAKSFIKAYLENQFFFYNEPSAVLARPFYL